MTVHELKCWPEFFRPIARGEKTFEIRKNDRDFQCGDKLLLREWYAADGGSYSGRTLTALVTYKTEAFQQPGWIVMAITIEARS